MEAQACIQLFVMNGNKNYVVFGALPVRASRCLRANASLQAWGCLPPGSAELQRPFQIRGYCSCLVPASGGLLVTDGALGMFAVCSIRLFYDSVAAKRFYNASLHFLLYTVLMFLSNTLVCEFNVA